jgi:hypothetical protein
MLMTDGACRDLRFLIIVIDFVILWGKPGHALSRIEPQHIMFAGQGRKLHQVKGGGLTIRGDVIGVLGEKSPAWITALKQVERKARYYKYLKIH